MSRWITFSVLTAFVLAIAGCGKSGPKLIEVTGFVKYDGQPVAEGDITFLPVDKTVAGEGGKIKDGRYTMKVKEGKNQVSIMATRAVPGKKGPMGEELTEQYIPGKYNDSTELTVDVAPGTTEHNFDLKK